MALTPLCYAAVVSCASPPRAAARCSGKQFAAAPHGLAGALRWPHRGQAHRYVASGGRACAAARRRRLPTPDSATSQPPNSAATAPGAAKAPPAKGGAAAWALRLCCAVVVSASCVFLLRGGGNALVAYVSDNVDLAGLIVTVTFALFGAVVAYFEKARSEDQKRADEARAEDRKRAEEARSEDQKRAEEARAEVLRLAAEDRQARDALAADVRHSMRRMDSHAEAAGRVQLLWTSLGARVVVQPPPLTASSPLPASRGVANAADARRSRRSSRVSR